VISLMSDTGWVNIGVSTRSSSEVHWNKVTKPAFDKKIPLRDSTGRFVYPDESIRLDPNRPRFEDDEYGNW
jgi:hypothetical protein